MVKIVFPEELEKELIKEIQQGKFDHLFALAKFKVITADAFSVVDSVLTNALAKQTIFATPVSVVHVVLLVEAVETVRLSEQVCPAVLNAKTAVPAEVGVPVIVVCQILSSTSQCSRC